MATAEQLRHEFESFMKSKGINYTVIDESDNVIAMLFRGNDNDTHVVVDFDENGGEADGVHFFSERFAKCKGSISSALPVINKLNRDYRWVTFFVDDEGAISATSDAIVYPGSVGPECVQCVFRMSGIIERALDELKSVAEIDLEAHHMLSMITLLRGRL